MPNVTRRVLHACPKCSLSVTVVTTDEGTSFEYDIAEWARVCGHPNSGTPLACPTVQPLLKAWLGNT